MSYRDKQHGYAKRKRVEELNHALRQLSDTRPRDIPKESSFLLERDNHDLSRESLFKKEYWVEAMEAAIKAGRRKAKMGRRAKRASGNLRKVINRNERLGVFAVEREIREDRAMLGQLSLAFPGRGMR